MAIRIKVARSAKELRDVYRLRRSIYHDEEGFFQGQDSEYITDIYDSVPNCVNIIAYIDDGTPVGTIRTVVESEIGTPSDDSYDFGAYRARLKKEAAESNGVEPRFLSAGMLAIAAKWRNRRDVFRSLIRMAADVAKSQGVTHVIATVNIDTIGIYKRLGWEVLSEPIMSEEIGCEIIALGTSVEVMYQWVFDTLFEQRTLLEHFSGCFQWYLLDKGAVIFEQDGIGEEAYLITRGEVEIACRYKENEKSLSLARLTVGDMFGELSLIDDAPRSASAIARSNVELLVIQRDAFWEKTQENPTYLRDLMNVLSTRLRAADERAILYAHAPLTERLSYFVRAIEQNAVDDLKKPGRKISKTTVAEFAGMALASTDDVQSYLQGMERQGRLTLEENRIIFFSENK